MRCTPSLDRLAASAAESAIGHQNTVGRHSLRKRVIALGHPAGNLQVQALILVRRCVATSSRMSSVHCACV